MILLTNMNFILLFKIIYFDYSSLIRITTRFTSNIILIHHKYLNAIPPYYKTK